MKELLFEYYSFKGFSPISHIMEFKLDNNQYNELEYINKCYGNINWDNSDISESMTDIMNDGTLHKILINYDVNADREDDLDLKVITLLHLKIKGFVFKYRQQLSKNIDLINFKTEDEVKEHFILFENHLKKVKVYNKINILGEKLKVDINMGYIV